MEGAFAGRWIAKTATMTSRKFEELLQDLRYALRMLRRSPGFTAAAVLSLALGIGANTAVFSLIDAVLLRNLPVRAPDRLVAVGDQQFVNGLSLGNERMDMVSWPVFRELRDRNHVFEDMYANGRTGQVTEGAADTTLHTARLVSGAFFHVLGIQPALGRGFEAPDADLPGRTPVVVISDSYWQRGFQRNPNIIGRRLLVNHYPLTIAGVMPRNFYGDIVGANPDMWIPMGMQPQIMNGRSFLDDRSACWLQIMGRLRPGVSLEQARAQMDALLRRVMIEHAGAKATADDIRDIRTAQVFVQPGANGFSSLRSRFSSSLFTLMALVGVVLLIACGNLANLLLARATARRREMAVRVAIGAGRARLLSQLVTESLLLAMMGGSLGLIVAFWTSQGFLRLVSGGPVPVPLDVTPDANVFLFTFGAALFTGLLFGFAPAIRAARVEVAPTLRETSRSLVDAGGRFSPGRMLVIAQVALSVLLVFGAGLFIRTVRNLQTQDFGFARENILMLQADARGSGYKPAMLATFCTSLTERLRSLRGVRSAAFSENGLFSGTDSGDTIQVPGFAPRSDHDLDTAYDRVSAGYFETIGARILSGRGIEAQDGLGAQKVAVINQSMARYFFPGQNPLGREFRINNGKDAVQIVGIVQDIRDHKVRGEVPRRFYLPSAQLGGPALEAFNFEIRTAGDPAALTELVRQAVKQFNPALRVFNISPVDEQIGDSVQQDRLLARLSAIFGAIALVLAAFGLYGVLSYNVARRSGEIGIRMALGASSGGVLWMVLSDALMLAIVGLIIGVPAAMLAGRLVASRLFGLASYDAATLFGAAAVIVCVAAFAAWLPARRAAGTDPMTALRYE